MTERPSWHITTDLVQAGTQRLAAVAARHPSRPVTVLLSGGSTPQALFKAWAGEPFRSRLPWDRLILFWGDERTVPHDSPESNYGNAWRLWLASGAVPAAQIHPWPTELPPEDAARAYQDTLKAAFSEDPPHFDLVFLGIGPEGHTASLFPHSPAFRAPGWTAAVFVPEKDTWRLTVTPKVLTHASEVVFLAAGSDKAEIVPRVLLGPDLGEELPAQVISRGSRSLWLLDPKAAAGLPADHETR
jgi:6-phosphogluconolactonase